MRFAIDLLGASLRVTGLCGGDAGSGARGEIRTPDLLVRSQTLYPTELRAHALPTQDYQTGLKTPSFRVSPADWSASKLFDGTPLLVGTDLSLTG